MRLLGIKQGIRRLPHSDDTLYGDLVKTFWFFTGLTVLGWVFVFLSGGEKFSVSLIWSVACLMAGAVVGFLFGIPKILQSEKTSIPQEGSRIHYRQQVNTNLEQISDWLTKIIVGLGLIELRSVPGYLRKLANLLSEGLEQSSHAFAFALIVYFSILGFLFGYLATRLFLAGAFSRADRATDIELDQFKSLATEVSPELLKEVLLQKSETEPSKEKEVEESDTIDQSDKANFDRTLEELNNK